MQEESVWHFIIDFDGFKEGKKRYPINEDDFPAALENFCRGEEPGKFGMIAMGLINQDNFFNLCSEFHLRRPRPIEVAESEFVKLMGKIEASL